jgi:hypothetical protein
MRLTKGLGPNLAYKEPYPDPFHLVVTSFQFYCIGEFASCGGSYICDGGLLNPCLSDDPPDLNSTHHFQALLCKVVLLGSTLGSPPHCGEGVRIPSRQRHS